jgi:hypothetical protein
MKIGWDPAVGATIHRRAGLACGRSLAAATAAQPDLRFLSAAEAATIPPFKRIAYFRVDPPPANWDGVYEAKTKAG